ncbi:hypothetical protein FB45DRAFT_1010078 [Roridomyces roridus]|uniref:Uncharacterized protein n=1 Tax=Roridomyces roridus TaxID=1738132 RepID=A0AAD7B529_9AGAR|nr:hypothetical protein FB45DRAFT_1010078 [Roridomyces roridus]
MQRDSRAEPHAAGWQNRTARSGMAEQNRNSGITRNTRSEKQSGYARVQKAEPQEREQKTEPQRRVEKTESLRTGSKQEERRVAIRQEGCRTNTKIEQQQRNPRCGRKDSQCGRQHRTDTKTRRRGAKKQSSLGSDDIDVRIQEVVTATCNVQRVTGSGRL